MMQLKGRTIGGSPQSSSISIKMVEMSFVEEASNLEGKSPTQKAHNNYQKPPQNATTKRKPTELMATRASWTILNGTNAKHKNANL